MTVRTGVMACALVAMATACSKAPRKGSGAQTAQRASARDRNIELSIDTTGYSAEKERLVQKRAVDVVRQRLDATALANPPSVRVPRPNTILVTLFDATDDEQRRVISVLTRSGKLEFRIVARETAFRDALVAKVKADFGGASSLGISIAEDPMHADSVWVDTYAVASKLGNLERWLALARPELPVSSGDELLVGTLTRYQADGGVGERARTYVVARAQLTGAHVFETRLVEEDGHYQIALYFDDEGARLFELITEENVGNKLAIVLDGKVSSAPVIQDRIAGGQARITMGGSDPATQRADAEDLINVLKSGALPVPLVLVSPVVGP